MNPFSGFLQAPVQRPLEGMATTADILRQVQDQRQLRQRQLENTQQNALAQQAAKRADAELSLQQGEQSHRFDQQHQKQVEDARAEYYDAQDQGDQVRLSRAAQMLQRLGVDVNPPKPNLQALTGQSLLPKVRPDAATIQALTGQGGPEKDLSQKDFEEQLINSTQGSSADSGEEPDIAGHLASVGPLKALKLNTAEEQQELPGSNDSESAEILDADAPGEFEKRQADYAKTHPGEAPPRLATQLLPNVPSDKAQPSRWESMVSGVFQPLIEHDDPAVAAAATRAQALAQRAVSVSGYSPEKAIRMGMDYLEKEAGRSNAMGRAKLRVRPSGGSASPASPAFNPKARQFFTGEMHESVQKFKNENIETGIRGYDSGLSALNSDNPASQNDAINQLIATRSGKTVSDRERAIYDNIAGIWNGVQKKFNLAAGNPMPEEIKGQLRALLLDAKGAVVQAREERAKAAEAYHRAKLRGAPQQDVEADSKAVGEAIRMGPGDSLGSDNSDLWQ